jgi:aspartyl-tRNA(Asn)/glutamyl-tRNA(Gln) amidotransferase subunit A
VLNSTLAELSAALSTKKVSSVELTQACLERIRRFDGELKAFVTVDEQRALAEARQADARRRRSPAFPSRTRTSSARAAC